jgi:hypothetical protein
VSTWDLFDGGRRYGGELDGCWRSAAATPPSPTRTGKSRFRRWCVLGPFSLKAGERAHGGLPEYVGAVRVMVVAGDGGAYGSAESPFRAPGTDPAHHSARHRAEVLPPAGVGVHGGAAIKV